MLREELVDVMRFKIMGFWQRKWWHDLKVAINNKEDIYTISGSMSTGMRFMGGKTHYMRGQEGKQC